MTQTHNKLSPQVCSVRSRAGSTLTRLCSCPHLHPSALFTGTFLDESAHHTLLPARQPLPSQAPRGNGSMQHVPLYDWLFH